jgi:hypothetical protein
LDTAYKEDAEMLVKGAEVAKKAVLGLLGVMARRSKKPDVIEGIKRLMDAVEAVN